MFCLLRFISNWPGTTILTASSHGLTVPFSLAFDTLSLPMFFVLEITGRSIPSSIKFRIGLECFENKAEIQANFLSATVKSIDCAIFNF